MTFKFQGHTKHLSSRSSIVSVLLMFHSNCADVLLDLFRNTASYRPKNHNIFTEATVSKTDLQRPFWQC